MKKNEIILGKLKVRTFSLPQDGFDPMTASPAELTTHGIVPRPDPKKDPKLYSWWLAVYEKPLKHITPEFGIGGNPRSGTMRSGRTENKDGGFENDSTSGNWSGSVLFAAPGTYKWIEGTWNVPNPQSPTGRCDGNWYYSAAWIGIDGGNGTGDVLQAGTHQGEQCIGGNSTQSVFAWWEWVPGSEQRIPITNFKVSAGDIVSCMICVHSSILASIYFSNQTSKTHTSFGIIAPPNTTLVGNTAEWVVERPTRNNIITQLADYGTVYFSNAAAGTANNTTVNAGSGSMTDMTDDYGFITSVASVVSENEIKCSYVLSLPPSFFMVWKGIDGDQGIYYSRFDGNFWLPQKNVRGVATSNGPALAYYKNEYYMAWKGVEGDQGIYYSSLAGDLPGNPDWAPQSVIRGTGTSYHPCLAVFNDNLYAAWKGSNNDHGIYYSVFNTGWSSQQNVPGVGTSFAPSLAAYLGRLYMAWRGVDDDQGIYFSWYDGRTWAAQQRVQGVATSVGPGLAVYGGLLYMAWKGEDGDQNIYFSSFDGSQWVPQQNVNGIATSVGPALAAFGDQLYMSWKGIDGDQGMYYSFFNGTNWAPQQNVINVGTSTGPSLAVAAS